MPQNAAKCRKIGDAKPGKEIIIVLLAPGKEGTGILAVLSPNFPAKTV
jgi:hypothetical protein